MKLTEKTVAQLTLRRGENERQVADDGVAGLRLRLRQGRNGVRKTWIYKYEMAPACSARSRPTRAGKRWRRRASGQAGCRRHAGSAATQRRNVTPDLAERADPRRGAANLFADEGRHSPAEHLA